MKHCHLITLGCKVNQCESAALGHLMQEAGYRLGTDGTPADVVIINTCTVTGKAAMQSRQAVRKAVRSHPGARVVVTGCYAQTAAEEIASIAGVDLIVGHADKLRLAELLERYNREEVADDAGRESRRVVGCPAEHFIPLPAGNASERTRAFLKIQDGCNAMCSYCIVPYARGKSRSMPAADVLGHMRQLGAAGFHEVVLTGIHLGLYGADLDPPFSLTGLLDSLEAEDRPVARMRLSSIEPAEVDTRLITQMAQPDSLLCPHAHIPLQSGDNGILRRMGRPYTRERFAHVIQQIRDALPDAAIGTDVLVGFPGEDDAAFEQTFELIRQLPVTYLHVFPFSPRKGTPAASFKGKVPERIVKARCRRLRNLGEKKKAAFYESLVGRTVQVLVETEKDRRTGLPKGLSANYVPVLLSGAGQNRIHTNTLVRARIHGADGGRGVFANIF